MYMQYPQITCMSHLKHYWRTLETQKIHNLKRQIKRERQRETKTNQQQHK